MNVEQTFQLMDSLLPYEVCSYHQILPLAVQGESLILGMVDPHNVSILDYVRPILKPKNFFIKRRTLESKLYEDVLAKYQVHQRQLRSQPDQEDDSIPTLIHGQESLAKSRASVLKNQDNQEVNTVLAATPLKANGFLQTLQPLETRNKYVQAPGSVLSQLPPHELMLEIFGRSLERNITQISLERQDNFGRVIWSRNNQSKVLLDRLPAPLFQGLMHELKRLTDVPVKPVEQPKKVEMLRLYQSAPVLLRLRFVPGKFGEQAAVQIFRGALLQQYQKSQMATLGKELMQIAGLLDQKLRQAAARSQINPEAIEALPLLKKNLAKMNRNISLIQEKQVKW
jgi:type II secretory ATPase GspE/PulE/Tfp pilus assembly ATPase PilB-like protein